LVSINKHIQTIENNKNKNKRNFLKNLIPIILKQLKNKNQLFHIGTSYKQVDIQLIVKNDFNKL